jgi:hypothetical protein
MAACDGDATVSARSLSMARMKMQLREYCWLQYVGTNRSNWQEKQRDLRSGRLRGDYKK